MIKPDDLRALADFLDDRPTLCAELCVEVGFYTWETDMWESSLTELGTFTKAASDYYLTAKRTFGDLPVELHIAKSMTCERVVVGQRQVEKEVYPADVTPVIETVTEDIVEWRCPETWKARA